jgi:hypothetical protein
VLDEQNESFREILFRNNQSEILDFLKNADLEDETHGFEFSDILWKLKDKEFYMDAVQVLRDRRIFDKHVWKYAFIHGDVISVQEYLR